MTTRDGQFVLEDAGRLIGGAIGYDAIFLADEMDRERAARQKGLHGRNVFRLILRQSFVRKDWITKAFQLPLR